MKEIQLTQGKVALVDDEDYEYLNQWKWYACKICHVYYAIRRPKTNGKYTSVYMHREILNTPKGIQVDHEDHNGLNNQRANIRLATNSENSRNRKLIKGKYKGVYHSGKKTWRAYITVNKKPVCLGIFRSEKDAAVAYNKEAKKHYAEFACLNAI